MLENSKTILSLILFTVCVLTIGFTEDAFAALDQFPTAVDDLVVGQNVNPGDGDPHITVNLLDNDYSSNSISLTDVSIDFFTIDGDSYFDGETQFCSNTPQLNLLSNGKGFNVHWYFSVDDCPLASGIADLAVFGGTYTIQDDVTLETDVGTFYVSTEVGFANISDTVVAVPDFKNSDSPLASSWFTQFNVLENDQAPFHPSLRILDYNIDTYTFNGTHFFTPNTDDQEPPTLSIINADNVEQLLISYNPNELHEYTNQFMINGTYTIVNGEGGLDTTTFEVTHSAFPSSSYPQNNLSVEDYELDISNVSLNGNAFPFGADILGTNVDVQLGDATLDSCSLNSVEPIGLVAEPSIFDQQLAVYFPDLKTTRDTSANIEVIVECVVSDEFVSSDTVTITLFRPLVDSDGDGVGNDLDICAGGDDNVDTDSDGTPDFCDTTPNGDDDGDGVDNLVDICPGGDDNVDTDSDGTPDFCDTTPNGEADTDARPQANSDFIINEFPAVGDVTYAVDVLDNDDNLYNATISNVKLTSYSTGGSYYDAINGNGSGDCIGNPYAYVDTIEGKEQVVIELDTTFCSPIANKVMFEGYYTVQNLNGFEDTSIFRVYESGYVENNAGDSPVLADDFIDLNEVTFESQGSATMDVLANDTSIYDLTIMDYTIDLYTLDGVDYYTLQNGPNIPSITVETVSSVDHLVLSYVPSIDYPLSSSMAFLGTYTVSDGHGNFETANYELDTTIAAPHADDDGDGVENDLDICAGGDDNVDTDSDGTPDFCDTTPNGDDDGDGVDNLVDICPGGDDNVDADSDGTPDFCDLTPLGSGIVANSDTAVRNFNVDNDSWGAIVRVAVNDISTSDMSITDITIDTFTFDAVNYFTTETYNGTLPVTSVRVAPSGEHQIRFAYTLPLSQTITDIFKINGTYTVTDEVGALDTATWEILTSGYLAYDSSESIDDPVEEVKKRNGSSCNDCVAPTFGMDSNNKLAVSDGFTYNGYSVDVIDYHTEYPLITVETNKTNTVAVKVYENKGVNNIQIVQFGLGMPYVGASLGDAQTLLEVWMDGVEVDRFVEVDKNNLVDVLNVTTSEVDCGGSEDSCLEVKIDYIYRDQPRYNVMAINSFDYGRNSQTSYFNDGIEVIGDSLNEPLTIQTTVSKAGMLYPQKAGLVELTLIDYKNNLWQDSYGLIWSTNEYGPYLVDEVPVPIQQPDDIWFSMTRENSNFESMIQYEQNRALNHYDAQEYVGVLAPSIASAVGITEDQRGQILDAKIAIEKLRAQEVWHTLGHAVIYDE